MNTNELNNFLTLASTLNFSSAANKCAMSTSTLSRSIQRLEKELDTQLFKRNNKTVSLTEKGLILKKFAEEFLLKYSILKKELKSQNNQIHGHISIYCSVTASYLFLPKILNKYRITYPHVELKIETGNEAIALKKLKDNVADFVIAAIPKSLPNNIISRELVKIPLVFIAPSEIPANWYTKYGDIDWKNIPYIVSEQGELRKSLYNWFKKNHIKPNIYAVVAGNEAIVSMVSLRMGIALIPKAVVEQTPLKDSINIIDEQLKIAPFNVSLCFNINKLNEITIKSFIDLLE
ncbi:MAG: HTH-type transcriptional activator IlvY [Succinivibrionaceae bacterium]